MARTKVSFATCNLYNLQLAGEAMYWNSTPWTDEQYDQKVAFTSDLMARLDASVWGFQELWHKQALDDFLPAGYDPLVPDDQMGGTIVCAGAVREGLLVDDPVWIADFPEKMILRSGGDDPQTAKISVTLDKFSRPVLHFRIKPRSDGKVISVYVAHFKSKRPTTIFYEDWYEDDKDYYKKHTEGIGAALATIRRTAEAAALRMILTDEIKGNNDPVVVLGDLNDGNHSNTLHVVTGQPNYLRAPWKGGGSDTDLYSVGAMHALRSLRDVFYTHIYQDTKETLDHILVSQEFYDYSKKRIWGFRGMEIVNDHLNRDDQKETGTTDHGIVRAEFEYRPA